MSTNFRAAAVEIGKGAFIGAATIEAAVILLKLVTFFHSSAGYIRPALIGAIAGTGVQAWNRWRNNRGGPQPA